jgi:hypothetical protein
MRNFLLAILLALTTSSAFGAMSEHCIPELGICTIMKWRDDSAFLSSVFIKRADWDKLNPDAIQAVRELQATGTHVTNVTDAGYNTLKQGLTTTNYSLANIDAGLSDIPDEAFDAWVNTAYCVGGAAVCGLTAYSSLQSGGATIWATRISCALTGIACVQAIRSWGKYIKVQEKAEEALKEAQGQSSSPAGPQEGPKPRPVPPVDPIIPIGSGLSSSPEPPKGEVTISESKE